MYLDPCSWRWGLERGAGLGSRWHGMDGLLLVWDEKKKKAVLYIGR